MNEPHESYRGDGSFQKTQKEYDWEILWEVIKLVLMVFISIGAQVVILYAIVYSAIKFFV